MEFVRVVKKLIPATMSLMFAFLPWKIIVILCKKWSSRKNKLDEDDPLPVVEDHHCADCLCKNPGLVAILLGEKNDLSSEGYTHNLDVKHNKCSTINTMKRAKIVQTINTNEFAVIATNISFGMKLTRAYLKKCRNPDFLNKQLKMIEEHFQRMVTTLNKVKEKLLARYESTSDSAKREILNKMDSKSDATLKEDNVHCGGCLCNNPGIITTLRESGRLSWTPEDTKMQTENLVESSGPSANFILPLFAQDELLQSEQNHIGQGQNPQNSAFISPGLQSELSFTREYLEMCKDQAFLAEQIKLIQEEGNQQQQKLSKLKQALLHRQKTCSKLLTEQVYPHLG